MALKFCSNCVMDGTAEELVLDEKGVCNFCHDAQRELALAKQNQPNFLKIIQQIKKDGRGRDYDCLIGLSGGVDSSTALVELVSWGLRPMTYSLDNGYNDPLADNNVQKLVEKLKVPFYRYRIDYQKFRELQAAFLKAGLINVEIPTDHILMATAFEMAKEYNIKWIISGGNVATESIMPASWSYNARDLTHIKDVYYQITKKELTGLPLCSVWKWNYYRWIKRIKTFYLLDYLEYNRDESIEMLIKRFDWQPYGDKHCESVFTKWFQNFYLFQKFGIDKRKAHYSSLINSGQMTRKEAMKLLTVQPVYPQFGIENRVLAYRKRSHHDFKQDRWYALIARFIKLWRF